MAMNPLKEENTKTESSSYMLPDGNVIEVCNQVKIFNLIHLLHLISIRQHYIDISRSPSTV